MSSNVPMNTPLAAKNRVITMTADSTPNLNMIGNRAVWSRLMCPNVRPAPFENGNENENENEFLYKKKLRRKNKQKYYGDLVAFLV